jgi:hypothetical protein
MVTERSWVQEVILGVPEGYRHATAVRLVGRWYGKGLLREEIAMLLVQWNINNSPPLKKQEIITIYQSTVKWERSQNEAPIKEKEIAEIMREVRQQMQTRE